jgi:DNA-binding MarR family transcriptional regulator
MAQPAETLNSPIHLLHRASQRADGLFASHVRAIELTPRQFAVLQAVAENNGLSQTDIMAATGIDRSSTAELVRRLVTNGSLQRRRTRRDARVYAVRITPSGRHLLGVGAPAVWAAEEALLRPIPKAQRSAFLNALMLIADSSSGCQGK